MALERPLQVPAARGTTGPPRSLKRCVAALAGAGLGLLGMGSFAVPYLVAEEKEVLRKHVTPEAIKAVLKGLDYPRRRSRPTTARGAPAAARRIRSP